MSEKQKVCIQVSSNIYGGFQYFVPYDRISSEQKDDLIDEIKSEMKTLFKTHNLQILADGIDKLKLHLHIPSYFTETIYACDCGDNQS